jgi:hypothetical protein
MEKDVLSVFLPELLLSYFDIVELKKLCNISSKKEEYYIHLNEKNTLPEEIISSDYESKGFLPPSTIQDFPIRGKAVYLVIKRRRWRNKLTKKEYTNDYSFITEGSKLTKELSDFLKYTGRDPRRYDK